jgi:hypothetical protein
MTSVSATYNRADRPVISRCASVLESVFLVESIGDRNQRSFLAGAEDLAIVGAHQRQVPVGAPLPPMIDRIRLAVDHVNQGCVEPQAVDVAHGLANLVDMAKVRCRCIVACAEHALGRGQRDQRRGDRGAIVASHHQDGGKVVANVFGVGELEAVGFGCVATKAQRRPIVDRKEDTWSLGHLLPNQVVHRLDQGCNLEA